MRIGPALELISNDLESVTVSSTFLPASKEQTPQQMFINANLSLRVCFPSVRKFLGTRPLAESLHFLFSFVCLFVSRNSCRDEDDNIL